MTDIQAASKHIAKHVGYSFTNVELLQQALTHRSAAKDHNERLEFLGDAILGMVVARALFERYPDIPEGKLTRMRASLVKGETLAQIGKEFALGDWILLGPGELKSGGHRRSSIIADAVEAIFGAIYLDADVAVCEEVILNLLDNRIEQLDPNAHPKDPKTQLQEYLQSRRLPLPEYEVTNIEGKDHAQTFYVDCNVNNVDQTTSGIGSSRRKAEQHAAQLMLAHINTKVS
ncbi:ribonuclease III [Alteromonas facilis]|uniref:ribonuclease III n=1 Tax=Alteromonas facilis TaxID=2048004 RepID=UPI000C28385D|nr:ribonuclease III [Alteromonas facilis]